MIKKLKLRRGLVLIHKENSDLQYELVGKKDTLWKARRLTERRGVYKGTHTFLERVLNKRFDIR